ncbi:MAG: hypothetical protein Q4C72_01940 [Eubacteriales bacterium]|nr:hypothetical protein [Eubacteriales bacterium]
MQKKKRLYAAALAVLTAVSCTPGASAEDAGDTAEYVYRYELAFEGTSGTSSTFALSVLGTASDGGAAPVLHTGAAALQAARLNAADGDGALLSFTPAAGIEVRALDGKAGIERGTPEDAEGKGSYAGFVWSAAQDADLAALADGGRLPLGTLTVPVGKADASMITLLPWTQTKTGWAQYGRLAASGADKEALAQLIGANWRIENGIEGDPHVGCYQGYYASDDGQRAVDIGCGWQSLVVRSYRPQSELTLELYRDGQTALAAKAVVPAHTGQTGRVSDAVRFESLDYYSAGGSKYDKLPDGAYRLVLKKTSHAAVAVTGVTAANGSIFPQLTGQTITLPCGDLNGDDRVKLADRALLTARGRYGARRGTAAYQTYEAYDLDGDGQIGQRDLAILTAPGNYGAEGRTLALGETGGTT